MSPLAWVLALRRARQYVCCGREQQGCAVQALWGVEGAGAHSCTASAGGVRLVRTSPNVGQIGLANPEQPPVADRRERAALIQTCTVRWLREELGDFVGGIEWPPWAASAVTTAVGGDPYNLLCVDGATLDVLP